MTLQLFLFAAKKFEVADHLPFKRRLMVSHLPEDLIKAEKYKKSKAKVRLYFKYNDLFLLNLFNPVMLKTFLKHKALRNLLHFL